MTVELLETTQKGQIVACSYTLNNGKIEFSGKENIRTRIENSGVLLNGKVYKEKNGDKFLEALLVHFSGSYLRARLK